MNQLEYARPAGPQSGSAAPAFARRPFGSLLLPSRRVGAVLAFAGLAFFLHGQGAWADDAVRAQQPCGQAQAPHTAMTPPAKGPSSGTAPGSEGSTGWTGGTGGTHTGLTPQAPNPASPSAHPETVQGLDPGKESRREAC